MEKTTVPKPPKKKYCKNKHELTPDNIYYRRNGYGQCRECMLLADKRYRQSQKVLAIL